MKNKDDIYEAFLNTLDEDLRSVCEENGKAEKPFPYPYCGEKNIERLAKTLVGVLEKRPPDILGWCPSSIETMCTRPASFGRGDARFAVTVFSPARKLHALHGHLNWHV